MYKIIKIVLLLAVMWPVTSRSAEPSAIRDIIEDYRYEALALYREFLSMPNVADKPDDIERLLVWLEGAFTERGFDVRRLATAGNDSLYAGRLIDGAETTLLVYLQADGQPVDPSAWDQADPFVPVMKAGSEGGAFVEIEWPKEQDELDPEWRVFARSAADSKGPMAQFLVAIELLDRLGWEQDYSIKVIVDTEEELGSPNLAPAIAANRDLLAADGLLIFDGPPHASNRPTVTFGARGLLALTLTTYGPRVAQHSGHYGNFMPNPSFDLARLLASMKSEDGVVTIEGFYDGVTIDEQTRAVLDSVPDDESAILGAAWLGRSDAVGESLQEALQYPSLNIRGMRSAWVGEQVRTIIPPTATAEIDIRLVKESDWQRLLELVTAHIETQGYTVFDRVPTESERTAHERVATLSHDFSYGAFRSPYDSMVGRMARSGLVRLYDEEPVLVRTMGGSIPIAPIIDELGMPAAIVPSVNIDNNQHSPNENLKLGSFYDGLARLMAVLSETPPAELGRSQ
jgi:acetylornithine deacetylase/succinyl-diaminopimelate desuccinylase-like protein